MLLKDINQDKISATNFRENVESYAYYLEQKLQEKNSIEIDPSSSPAKSSQEELVEVVVAGGRRRNRGKGKG